MHRTTTTATLLVSVAVSALAGCVTVQRPPNPGPPPASSRPSSPRPDGSGEPRVVQAPAREALEMVGPSPRPSPPPAAPEHATRPAQAAPHRTAAATPPQQTRPAPHVEVPPAVSNAFPKDTGVCALGRRYGGWQPDSPEATICRDTYGR
ncbi:hypothetical protein N8I84_07325 [Streptomyces cynarae]|uniref:Lipoprotein n=1 Tax=Streptomyces cynarae TaxID=2981134 RepID=A0ABY6DWI8_9ACTN|nr:hypothetical protein [Streptomyces cynarae]UXY18558.1 hypothetical protein N8I84_07325 [Streptomyces cynarae]